MAIGDMEPTTAAVAEPTDEVKLPTDSSAAAVSEEAASAGSGAASSAPTFDLSTEDGIQAALKESALLRGRMEKAQNDGFQNGKQNRDAELRREQGSVERAGQYHEWVVKQLQEGVDPAEIAKQTPLFVKGNEDYLKAQLGKAWVETTLGHFGESDAELIRGVLEGLDGDPDEIVKLASKTIDAASKRIEAKALDAFDPASVPKDSKTYERLVAWHQAQITEEAETQALEAKRVVSAPRVRGGGPGSVGMSTETAKAMDPREASNPDKWDEWRSAFLAGT